MNYNIEQLIIDDIQNKLNQGKKVFYKLSSLGDTKLQIIRKNFAFEFEKSENTDNQLCIKILGLYPMGIRNLNN